MSNLTRRGLTYFARFHIPRDRQADVGRAFSARSGVVRDRTRTLETRNRSEALKRLGPAIEAIRAEVDDKLRTARLPPLAGDWTASWADRALDLRATLRAASPVPLQLDDSERVSARDLTMDTIREAAEKLADTRGVATAEAFWAAATGAGITIHEAATQWLAVEERGRRAQTVGMHRATLRLLGEFLRDHHDTPSLAVKELASVDRRLAAAYMTWRAATPTKRTGRPPSRATIQRETSTLTGLWRWAIRNGHADLNPWADQMAGVPATTRDEDDDGTKRPYAPAELVTLLRAGSATLAPNGGGYCFITAASTR